MIKRAETSTNLVMGASVDARYQTASSTSGAANRQQVA